MVNSCQGSWSLQRFKTWTWAVNPEGTFSLRVVFLSWCSSHLFSPKFPYSHERILELTPPTVLSVWEGQNESCVQLSLVLLILPGTLSLQLLQFDAEVASWDVFRLQADHIFSFTPLPCLSCQFWVERLHDHRCLCSLLFSLHGTFVQALELLRRFFFKCQSSCTIYSWMSLKMFKTPHYSSIMLRRENDERPVQDGWFPAHTGPVPASATTPNLAAMRYSTISLMHGVHWRAPLSDRLNIITHYWQIYSPAEHIG